MENNQEKQSTSSLTAENTDSPNTMATSQVTVDFAKGFGSNQFDEASGVDIDKDGNSYIAGSFRNNATFGDKNLENNSSRDDAFVAKLDKTGNVAWAQRLGGISSDAAYGISVDESGNSYVTGTFQGEVTFRTGTPKSDEVDDAPEQPIENGETQNDDAPEQPIDEGETSNDDDTPPTTNTEEIKFTSKGSNDAFVAKLDNQGKVQWAKQFGGTGFESGEGITVDSQGNTFVTGSFRDTVSFGEAPALTANGSDGFITKLDTTGKVLWANKFGGNDADEGYEVAVDKDGNSYVMGTTDVTSSSAGKLYIAKIDDAGNFAWRETFEGTANREGSGVAVDKAGNTYFTGLFRGTATFGDTSYSSSFF